MRLKIALAALFAGSMLAGPALAQSDAQPDRPWMNTKLTPDQRAALLQPQLTLDEEFELIRGDLGLKNHGRDKDALGSAGLVPGLPRLGIPDLQETDASLGVANPLNVRKGDGATPLPSGLALAATFDPELAYAGGKMIGHEAIGKGFNVLLAGGMNLTRDPRNGRNFEYLGEDPLLAATLDAASIRGIQSNGVLSTIKHYALNAQETGRRVLDARIDEAALRESDLLAFEMAIEAGKPGSVMCGYNKVNGAWDCQNPHLLNEVLKGDWRYPGFVMSDWGAVHAAADVLQGLDQESAAITDNKAWFDKPLKAEVEAGRIPRARIDDMVRRILRSMFATGLFDTPKPAAPLDYEADAQPAKAVAEAGSVLLKNDGLLPLSPAVRRIVVISGHADVGVLSGGGSSQVLPVGGAALSMKMPTEPGDPDAPFHIMVYDPSSPLKAIKAAAPDAVVDYVDGTDPRRAAEKAKGADVAIVFATQWMIEAYDAANLSLPDDQDKLIAAVTAANPKTVVVLETGNPVLMPWLGQTGAVLEAWYPGARGGEAIADLLFGKADPSGRLPITFPSSEAELPRPTIPGAGAGKLVTASFPVDYVEGADVGYRWDQLKGIKPLFPFGYGLSYTTFAYSGLKATGGQTVRASVTVKNTGRRAGADVVQVYAAPPGGMRRLIGFQRVMLRPGESRRVSLVADPRLLASYAVAQHGWRVAGGAYAVAAGGSSADLPLTEKVKLQARRIAP